MSTCSHPHPVTKKYVGSTETYQYCPVCFETWGGEETPAKKKLIAAAALADDLGISSEQEEVAGNLSA